MADHASVALARLRRDIERQKKSIHESLERFLRAHREEGVLQEEFVTIRNERFVVPVIAGQRRKIDGVIHGASSSGHTLFVEPLETIDLNNELVRLTEEEMREVHRILLEMTNRLRAYGDSIRQTLVTMAELELIFGKARFAADFDCVIPRFGERLLPARTRAIRCSPTCCAAAARSPVPISLELTRERRTLLISGPNTGGKTVTLKTVGLLSLMAQAGLPVPAAEAEFPLFEQVLADIGDYQSIQENLSTFSAHVSNIREMALDVTPDSLVLLDELGAATDPEEGGALGVAMVEHFRAAGAFTLVSTHLMALKIYGASTEGVVNGSMGFDEETFEPTYHLRLGLPGKSAGLEIATRLGMPEDIMRRARLSMSDRERDVTRFLSELHHRIEETQALEDQPAREDRSNSTAAKRRSRASGRSARPPRSRNWSAAPTRRWPNSRSRRRRPSARSRRAATAARPIRTRSAASPRPSANCAKTSRPSASRITRPWSPGTATRYCVGPRRRAAARIARPISPWRARATSHASPIGRPTVDGSSESPWMRPSAPMIVIRVPVTAARRGARRSRWPAIAASSRPRGPDSVRRASSADEQVVGERALDREQRAGADDDDEHEEQSRAAGCGASYALRVSRVARGSRSRARSRSRRRRRRG